MKGIVTNCSYPLSNIFTPSQFIILAFLILTVVVFFLYPILIKHKKIGVLSLSLISVGGVVNLAERAVTGCVRDYFSFFGLFKFNISDLIMDIGIFLAFYLIWKKK